MSSFKNFFSEPASFSNDVSVLRGDYTYSEACNIFNEYQDGIGLGFELSFVGRDRVRYQFTPEGLKDEIGEACWLLGASGRGSKEVWVYGGNLDKRDKWVKYVERMKI